MLQPTSEHRFHEASGCPPAGRLGRTSFRGEPSPSPGPPSRVDWTATPVISFLVSSWGIELEPEVQAWLEDDLPTAEFATAAFQIDRLAPGRGATHAAFVSDRRRTLRVTLRHWSSSPTRHVLFPRRAQGGPADGLPQAALQRTIRGTQGQGRDATLHRRGPHRRGVRSRECRQAGTH